MKIFLRAFVVTIQLSFVMHMRAATLYVDLNSPNPTSPYSSWSTAATNIQDAIDVAGAGDLVLVTNGVYATGGKVMFGDLTNRVALDKAITVQSVNGPLFTTIRGNGATNGLNAVRCAWITNGAMLQGFTLTAGATRTGGDQTNAMSGGGALCIGTNAALQNCLVISNVAQTLGGGVYQGVVANTAIIGNRAGGNGSGAANASLLNCTVISNWQATATIQCRHTNSIVYYNASGNHVGGTFAYSCTTPAASGIGNIATVPQLFPDKIHLQSSSPCRGAGTNLTTGTDIDGQAWSNPPSIGCDEWGGKPVIITQPQLQLTNNPLGFKVSALAAGEEPLDYRWFRNGVLISNDSHFSFAQSPTLFALGVSEADAGNYQVVVSNSFGVVTSAVAQLVFRFVNVSNAAPLAPFTAWATAATNIQDAIDAAVAGEVILVTNGVYRTGGKGMGGDLINRVVLDKALLVQSVNGPAATIIQGNWNPSVTNGPIAIRCVWMTNGAALAGFTIRGGSTRGASGGISQVSGGGIWGSSTNAVVLNCLVVSNQAYSQGGGVHQVTIFDSVLIGNRAVGSGRPGVGSGSAGQGGGAAYSNLRNCLIQSNYADQSYGGGAVSCNLMNCALIGNSSYMNGGAAYAGRLVNCTVTGNTASGYSDGYGAAVHSATLTNCLVWSNYSRTSFPDINYSSSILSYCLSSPLAAGVGNIDIDPQLLTDGIHISESSPCRAAGTSVTVGADIDGQIWSNPPSIGCDEWQPFPVVAFPPTYQVGVPARSLLFDVAAAGQSLTYFWFRNGELVEDDAHHENSKTANLKVLKFGPEHAGDYYVVASNSFGMVTSEVAQVIIHCADAAGSNPVYPYSSWATAATNIQDAIDAAQAGGIVLVTNGVYSTGGKIMSGDLLNRVAIDKPMTVIGVNGYRNTIIEGAWDPVSTNGAAAVRGVWINDGGVFGGFTIRNGATRGGGFLSHEVASGGGVWAGSTNAIILNCLLTNNAARYAGGGIYSGTLRNSIVTGNIVESSTSVGGGGGAAFSDLRNCTVVANYTKNTSFDGAGTAYGTVRNCIVVQNYSLSFFGSIQSLANYRPGSSYAYSCTFPLISGVGNITNTPNFLDANFHLPAQSPCRAAGSSLFTAGEDQDGEEWANPPSMGADEVVDENFSGSISLSVNVSRTNTFVGPARRLNFWDSITGRVARIDWDFGDGVISTNANYTVSHFWTNPGSYTVTSRIYNNDNPDGVSASIGVEVLPLISPNLQSVSLQNGFKFSFQAQENAHYTVQYATNLAAPVNWRPLQTIFFSPGGINQITDPAWTNSARFYRILAQ